MVLTTQSSVVKKVPKQITVAMHGKEEMHGSLSCLPSLLNLRRSKRLLRFPPFPKSSHRGACEVEWLWYLVVLDLQVSGPLNLMVLGPR